jgi:hypothetical protein
MHCHLVIPGLLAPSGQTEEFLAGLDAAALSRLLSKGRIVSIPTDNYEAWMCQRYTVNKQDNWPLAPITLATDGGDPGDAYWLRADPVHLKVNRDQLILVDSSAFDISEAEAAAFTEALNKHFSTDGFVFHPLQPTRWYLRQPSPVELHCASLREATGRNINTLLPTGSDARRFHSLFNEAQMLLFAHPMNETRETAGQLPINSVWFWGGGKMPTIKRPPITGLWATDHLARGLARLASVPTADLPANGHSWLAQATKGKENLIVLDELEPAQQYGDVHGWQQTLIKLEQNWFVPILDALRAGRIAALTITGFGDDQAIEIKVMKSDLWKFWRGARQLANSLHA